MSLRARVDRLLARRRARRLQAGLAGMQRTRRDGVPATGSAPRDGGGQVDVGFTS